MLRSGVALLEFDPTLKLSKKKRLRDGLSSVIQIGTTLWVANDETVTLERLIHQGQAPDGVHRYGNHTQFALHDYLRLAVGIVNLLGSYTVCQSCGMDTLPVTTKYKNHRFPVEIISHAVWLYFRFCRAT